MRWLHIHYDRHWQENGIYRYYQCRCGARRTIWVNRGLSGPVDAGWPRLVDKHGRLVTDSGWQKTAT